MFVYVLLSLKNVRFYIGQTNNIQRRLAQHNTRKSIATRYQGPYKLVHLEIFQTRKEAVAREIFLKSGQGRAWLHSLGIKSVSQESNRLWK